VKHEYRADGCTMMRQNTNVSKESYYNSLKDKALLSSHPFRSALARFGIILGYGLDDRGSRVRFPAEAGNFSLHHRVWNGSGTHPASYPMGTRGSFPEIKRPRRESDHSPPSSAEVK
jgi:hypothetical protein